MRSEPVPVGEEWRLRGGFSHLLTSDCNCISFWTIFCVPPTLPRSRSSSRSVTPRRTTRSTAPASAATTRSSASCLSVTCTPLPQAALRRRRGEACSLPSAWGASRQLRGAPAPASLLPPPSLSSLALRPRRPPELLVHWCDAEGIQPRLDNRRENPRIRHRTVPAGQCGAHTPSLPDYFCK